MARNLNLTVATLLAATLHSLPADARYNQHDAVRDCQRQIVVDDRFTRLYAVGAQDERNHSYTVEGKVAMRDAGDPFFSCSVLHKEVLSWRAGDGTLAGGGILGAAVPTLIEAQRNPADAHAESRQRYADGHGYAFDDQRYLEEECRRAIMRSLEASDIVVAHLDLGRYRIDERSLIGEGQVTLGLERSERRLAFSCAFDRRGRIVDGNYRYQ